MKLAVIGDPIDHSKTPELQRAIGKAVGVDVTCDRITARRETAAEVIERLKSDGYDGFNCTYPCKSTVYELTDQKSDRARALGAVNTVMIRGGVLYGDTTDGVGMFSAIKYRAPEIDIPSCTVTVIGAGGTARAIIFEAANIGAGRINIVNRTYENALAASRTVRGSDVHIYGIDELDKACGDIVINATTLGMESCGSFESFDFIENAKKSTIFADAVYRPMKTDFLKTAEAHGFCTVSGLDMLTGQGIASFEMWYGRGLWRDIFSDIRGVL